MFDWKHMQWSYYLQISLITFFLLAYKAAFRFSNHFSLGSAHSSSHHPPSEESEHSLKRKHSNHSYSFEIIIWLFGKTQLVIENFLISRRVLENSAVYSNCGVLGSMQFQKSVIHWKIFHSWLNGVIRTSLKHYWRDSRWFATISSK